MRNEPNGGGHSPLLHFDIALTQSRERETEGQVGVLFAPIGGKFIGSLRGQDKTVSRIRFDIPVSLPFAEEPTKGGYQKQGIEPCRTLRCGYAG